MKRNWIYQYLVLHCATLIWGESYYTVIAPGLMKSNRKYNVAVTLHEAQEPSAIRVSIVGPSYNAAEEILVQPFETKSIEFQPPKLAAGYYKLIAEGLTGFEFKNESKLSVDGKNGPKIYIQTDKAIYKPQDLVQFRVVILDEHTRPLYIKEPIRIEIFDHLDNRVKQFKDIVLVKGVYTGQFQLSQQPVLGYWQIKVFISGKYAYSRQKEIQVKNYVLPKLSVFIKTPKDVVLEDGNIRAIIYGKYTFDKYVEGNVTAQLYDPFNEKVLLQKKLYIDTLSLVEFQLENRKDFEKLYGVELRVNLTEKYTGLTQSDSTYITFQNEHYKIRIPDVDIEFQNNKPYRLKAYVEHLSGATVLDSQTPVLMEHGNKRYEAYLDENGVATFEFEHQSEAGHTVMYKDSKKFLPNILTNDNSMLNNTEYYCRLTLMDPKLRLGKTVEIEVSSIIDIPYLVYTIVGHGSLVHMEQIQVPPNQKSFIIQITPSIEMVPTSYVYVHYIHNGNLRYEEMALYFPNEFENQISVTAPKQVRPGQEVTIALKAQPKSYVSIMAVDLGVCLLDCSYDLKREKILRDLILDNTYLPMLATVYPGLTSGLITLTNAHYPYTPLENSGGVLPASVRPLRFRTKFPETWIFQNYEINDTETELTLNIPDTITTWRITAFSNNDVTGFGIVDGPTDITTIQPFFISLTLPYSVKRGEIVNIPVTIFNYLKQEVETTITMYNDDEEFYFMEPTTQGAENSYDGNQQIKHINVPKDGGKTVSFLINPKKVGEINLRLTATNSLYSDAIQQKLKVEPEGVAKYHNQAIFLSIPKGDKLTSSFSIELPLDRIPDSEYITFSVGGDFVVPALENLNDLLRMPTGCGEQNVVNFAPNILILQYLKANGKFAKEKGLVKKIRSYLDVGYQQQLSFRHKNGGYSVFGMKSDGEASTWLTAYVVRFFIKASKYTPIETKIIESGLEYLTKHQQANGEFENTGYLIDPSHQSKYGFTAFILLAFLEDPKYALKYQNIIQKGLAFLNSDIDTIEDVYSLSIIAVTLQIAKHSNAKKVIDKLKIHKMEDENGLMWWSENDGNLGKDVEITGYVLMALLNTAGDHLPVLKWLIKQRNAKGGFKSTHDTVVGLEALVKLSEKFNNFKNMNLKIKYNAQDLEGNEVSSNALTVQTENVLVLQKHELPKSTRRVNFELSGSGHALVQLSHQYYINTEQQFQHFLINPKANLLNSYEMNLEICFAYQSISSTSNDITNMVIMEANLPSGYRSDAESSSSLIGNEIIQRIESKNSESTIVLYFDNLSADVNHCLNIAADKTNDVIDLKPAAIIMYDYYNLSRSNTEFYNVQQ